MKKFALISTIDVQSLFSLKSWLSPKNWWNSKTPVPALIWPTNSIFWSNSFRLVCFLQLTVIICMWSMHSHFVYCLQTRLPEVSLKLSRPAVCKSLPLTASVCVHRCYSFLLLIWFISNPNTFIHFASTHHSSCVRLLNYPLSTTGKLRPPFANHLQLFSDSLDDHPVIQELFSSNFSWPHFSISTLSCCIGNRVGIFLFH